MKPKSRKRTPEDHLKELEKLLSKDVRDKGGKERGFLLSKQYLNRVLIRLGITVFLFLALYLAGIFENIKVVGAAVLAFALIEWVRYHQYVKYQKTGQKMRPG